MPSLADKLKSLGVKTGAAGILPPAKPAARTSLEETLEGRWLPTRRGEVFVVEQIYETEYRHGHSPIRVQAPLATLAAWARDENLHQLDISQFAFLDTETSGLSGGTGTYAFLVGAGRFINGNFHLSLFFMQDPAEEAALLEALADFLAPCAALVTYNGKAFDAPLLRTRYTLHSLPCPFEGYAHLDLLPLARRLWRARLPSRSLKYIEEHVLMAPRSSEEVPGYEIPWIYFDFLRNGDPAPLKGVLYHNAMDVVAMAALLQHAASMLEDPFSETVEHGLDVISLAKLYEDLKRWEAAARLYERGLEMSLPEADFWTAVQRLAALQKKRGDLAEAISWWQKAAGQGHTYAHVELAKYFEHTSRDAETALHHTQIALRDLDLRTDLPAYARKHWQAELEQRQARLIRKIQPGA